jgi:hypothetical protein
MWKSTPTNRIWTVVKIFSNYMLANLSVSSNSKSTVLFSTFHQQLMGFKRHLFNCLQMIFQLFDNNAFAAQVSKFELLRNNNYIPTSKNACTLYRVTRLGEFSPIGRLFSWGKFSKITKRAQIFGIHFSKLKVMHYFRQKVFGPYAGRF